VTIGRIISIGLKRKGLLTRIALIGLLWVSPLRAQSVSDSGLVVSEIVSGLSFPTNMAFIGANDILVLQKEDGRVRRVINGVLQAGEVLDLSVDTLSERGLLGIALHPNFAANSFVYLYYTQSSGGTDSSGSALDNRVFRYTWSGGKLINPAQIIILPVTDGPNHDGGIITFGPDGKLYIVIGDLNRNGRLQNFPAGPAPDDTGVILRLNDDGTVPNDNPFFAQGGNLAKYYAYGVRNSFGMAFDPVTGQLWDTENGPGSYDEINQVLPGFNSGWEQIMGPDALDPQGVGDLFAVPGSHYADPKFSWFDTVGLTAIAFVNSLQLGAQYRNDAFVGDINNGRLYRFKLNPARNGFVLSSVLADSVANNDGELTEVILGTGFGGITDLKVGPDGRLYVLSYGLGRIFAISRRLTVNCPGHSLQAAIDNAIAGDIIAVSGTCNQNILIANEKQRITIDGGGTATISAPSSVSPALNVRGKGVLIQGLTIAGGSHGVHVNRGSNAVINNNVIQNSNGNGVLVDELAVAVLTNNTIQNHPGTGVFVSEASTARIGFNADGDTVASPNMIQNNAVGVVISNGSSARIVGNTIQNSSGDGVQVLRDAHADIAGNAINGNGGDGVQVAENSVVQLGEDGGAGIFASANMTASTNEGFGIRCTVGSTADGRLGTLNGNSGAKDFSAPTCIDSLSP